MQSNIQSPIDRLIPYTEEYLGKYQSKFRKGKTTIEQLLIK